MIPGHGKPVSNRRELQAFRDMLVGVRDNVAKLKQQGRSLDETIAAKPTAPFDAKWGQSVITPALSPALSMRASSEWGVGQRLPTTHLSRRHAHARRDRWVLAGVTD